MEYLLPLRIIRIRIWVNDNKRKGKKGRIIRTKSISWFDLLRIAEILSEEIFLLCCVAGFHHYKILSSVLVIFDRAFRQRARKWRRISWVHFLGKENFIRIYIPNTMMHGEKYLSSKCYGKISWRCTYYTFNFFFLKKRSINMNRMIKTKTTKNNKFDKLWNPIVFKKRINIFQFQWKYLIMGYNAHEDKIHHPSSLELNSRWYTNQIGNYT